MYKNSLQDKILVNNIDDVDSDYGSFSDTVKLISFKTFSTGSTKTKVCFAKSYFFSVLMCMFIFTEYDCTRYVHTAITSGSRSVYS